MKLSMTITLILINISVFLFVAFDLDYYIENYGFKPSSFMAGRFEILGTAMFLHAGFAHLAFNMVALFLLGTSLESKVKPWEYLFTYLLGGIIGNLAMLIPFLFDPNSIGVGASGAISAIVGLGTFVCPDRLVFFPSILPLPFVAAGALYFLTTAMNLFVTSEIAYPVHLMGMIVGAFLGLSWSKERTKRVFLFVLTLLLIVTTPYIIKMVS